MSSASKATMGVVLTQALVAGVALASSASENSAEAYGKPDHGHDGYHKNTYGYDSGYDTKHGYVPGYAEDHYGHKGYRDYDGQEHGYDTKNQGYATGYDTKQGYGSSGQGYASSDYGASHYGYQHHQPSAYDSGYPHGPQRTYEEYSHSYDKGYGKHSTSYHRYDREPEYDADAYKKAYGYKKSDVNPYYFADPKEEKKQSVMDLLKQGSCFKPNDYGLHKCNGVSLYQLASQQCSSIWIKAKHIIDAACDVGKDPKKKKHAPYKGMHDYMYYHQPGYEAHGNYGYDTYGDGHYDGADHYEADYYQRSMKENEEYDPEPQYDPPTPAYTSAYDEYDPEPQYDPPTPAYTSAYDEYSAYGEVYKKFYPRTHRAMKAMQCREEGFHIALVVMLSCFSETGVLAAFVEKYSGLAQEAPLRGDTIFLQAYKKWATDVFKAHNDEERKDKYASIYSNDFAFPYKVDGGFVDPHGNKEKYGITIEKTGLKGYLSAKDIPSCPADKTFYVRDHVFSDGFYTIHGDFAKGFTLPSDEDEAVRKCFEENFGCLPHEAKYGLMSSSQMCNVDLSRPASRRMAEEAVDAIEYSRRPKGFQDVSWLLSLPLKQISLSTVLPSMAEIFTQAMYDPFPLTGEGLLLGCAHYACKANAHGKCKIGDGGCFPDVKDEVGDKLSDSEELEELHQCLQDGFLDLSDVLNSNAAQDYLGAAAETSPVCAFGAINADIFSQRHGTSPLGGKLIREIEIREYPQYGRVTAAAGDASKYNNLRSIPIGRQSIDSLFYRATLQRTCAENACKTPTEMKRLYDETIHELLHQCKTKEQTYQEYLNWWHQFDHRHGYSYGKKGHYSDDYSSDYNNDYSSDYKSDDYKSGDYNSYEEPESYGHNYQN